MAIVDVISPVVFSKRPDLASKHRVFRTNTFHSIIWIEGELADGEAHKIRHNLFGRVVRKATIPLGGPILKVPVGATVERGTSAHLLKGATLIFGDTEVGADLSIDAEDGTVVFASSVPADVLGTSLRYFYSETSAPTGLGAFRYPVFSDGPTGTAGSVSVEGQFYPTQQDHAGNGLTVKSAQQSYPTNFRSTYGRVITLTPIPGKSQIGYQWDPQLSEFYSVPKGDWELGLESQGTLSIDMDLLLGLSGVEYGRINSNAILRFVADAPAYAPGFGLTGPSASKSMTSNCPSSTYPVTTPWLYPIETAPGPTSGPLRGYYSQPNKANLFTPGHTGNFLDVLPLQAGNFPLPQEGGTAGATGVMGAPEASFPMVPYAGIGPVGGTAQYTSFGDFETEVITPARFSAIAEINTNAKAAVDVFSGATLPKGPTGTSGPFVEAVTPSGLLSNFSVDLKNWQRLTLARTHSSAGLQELQLTEIDDALRTALLSNQLFLVISDPEALTRFASFRYRVTTEVINYFTANKAPSSVIQGLVQLRAKGTYESLSYFEPDAKAALGTEYDQKSTVGNYTWGQLLQREAALASLTISDWTFNVAPGHWLDANGNSATIMILKFTDRDLPTLVNDLEAWTLADTFNKIPSETQQRLQAIIADSEEAAGRGEQEFDYFANTVAGSSQSRSWNGVLFLNVYVPTSEFPPELEGLAAGIAKPDFRAHHLGVNLSPVEVTNGQIFLKDSSLFGLIYYEDLVDLVFDGDPYDYKVLTLKILFSNSQISSFASQIELLIAALFGEQATLLDGQHGNNIILNGSWQKHGGTDSYSFTQEGSSKFEMSSKVLSSVLVTKAQFVTEVPESGLAASGQVSTRFLLWGALRYIALEGFDLFSFGPDDKDPGELSFSNMFVAMSFNRETQSAMTFSFEAGQMVFDASQSKARPESLYRRFPLSVSGMVQSKPVTPPGPTGATGATGATGSVPAPEPKTATPMELGFINVDTPLQTGALGTEWFGLELELNLGSRGALAGQAAISATLLAAWAPDPDNYNVAIGLRLPGSDGRSLKIAGPLTLDIGSIEMMLSQPDSAYMMQFRNIALGFLGLKFPPGGQTNVLLFGDPNPDSNNSSLGWYAAYKKDEKKKDDGDNNDVASLVLLDAEDSS